MKERPILFSAPMVRALLDGSKTQTRRVVKPQPSILAGELLCWKDNALTDDQMAALCPYGQPGDRLWVRESWHQRGKFVFALPDSDKRSWLGTREIAYSADAKRPGHDWRSRPSIHMPRWASRITLEITEVRVERLQDISEDDALAEGCSSTAIVHEDGEDYTGHYASEEYQDLWESINGPGSWDTNPWVWAVSFKRLEQPA
jgi:hypothetical protein